MRTHLIMPMLLAVLLAVSAARSQPSQPIDDWDILEAIETEFRADEVVSPDLLDVRVNAGVVTLSGQQFTLLAKRRAVTLAASLTGVRTIVNRVDVVPGGRSDKQVLGDVLDALQDDPVADHEELLVKVDDGLVSIIGTVESHPEKRLVAAAVANVRGVVGIDNRLEVLVAETRPDSEIKPEILRRFELSPLLFAEYIEVLVKDGVVTLTGAVGSVAEKSIARQLCWVAGVRTVDVSQLEVNAGLNHEQRRGGFTVLVNDLQLQRAVQDALLYDPRVRGSKVDVRARAGMVSLFGNVSSLTAKQAAEQDATNTLGVRRVANHLKVRPEIWPGDPAVTGLANDALARDSHVGGFDVNASSHFGKLFLHGEVNTSFERQRAKAIVANVPGVLDVVNRIRVDAVWQAKPDAEIKEDAERQMRFNALIDAGSITVVVHDGVVTLNGTVASRYERMAAENMARRAGARRVVNKLHIGEANAPNNERKPT